ncbi:hypothetical protein BHE74_00027847 [Ensete ventricosum]|nr:hypothetical protein BHE74_00027847 [Ensete ventricosum]
MFGTRRHDDMMDWIGEANRSRIVDGVGAWVTVGQRTPVVPSNPLVALHVSSPEMRIFSIARNQSSPAMKEEEESWLSYLQTAHWMPWWW